MNIGYHSDFMDRIIERADKRQERMEKMINKMLDKSEPILNAGKPKPMTNEEWFCTLSTAEKAKFLVMIQMSVMHPVKRGAVDMEKFIEEVAEWLKQPKE